MGTPLIALTAVMLSATAALAEQTVPVTPDGLMATVAILDSYDTEDAKMHLLVTHAQAVAYCKGRDPGCVDRVVAVADPFWIIADCLEGRTRMLPDGDVYRVGDGGEVFNDTSFGDVGRARAAMIRAQLRTLCSE